VWTFAYDVSGISRVELFYRLDGDGSVDARNLTYGTSAWCVVPMNARTLAPRTDPAPAFLADEYAVTVPGLGGSLVDYYVEAEDARGNVARSGLRHVWVGTGGGTGPGAAVGWYPSAPSKHSLVTVVARRPGFLHWGINGWTELRAAYWPTDTTAWGDGQAVDTPLSGPGFDGRYTAVLGPFDGATTVNALDFVIHYADDTWSGTDLHVTVDNALGTDPIVELAEPAADARLDGTVRLIAAASDDGAVSSVAFFVDGAPIGTLTTPPYELDHDTSSLASGAHTVSVTATDDDGNTASDEVSVEIPGGGTGECTVGPGPDGGVDADTDGSTDSGTDADTDGECCINPLKKKDDGCACSAVGGPGSSTPPWVLLLPLALLLFSRRRRARHDGN
jgi:MYXO-CTERM domain-containing protein